MLRIIQRFQNKKMYKIISTYKDNTTTRTECVGMKGTMMEAVREARKIGHKEADRKTATTGNISGGILLSGNGWTKSYTVVERQLPEYLIKR